eukprot:7382531-Prymnesium_polylepis.1
MDLACGVVLHVWRLRAAGCVVCTVCAAATSRVRNVGQTSDARQPIFVLRSDFGVGTWADGSKQNKYKQTNRPAWGHIGRRHTRQTHARQRA